MQHNAWPDTADLPCSSSASIAWAQLCWAPSEWCTTHVRQPYHSSLKCSPKALTGDPDFRPSLEQTNKTSGQDNQCRGRIGHMVSPASRWLSALEWARPEPPERTAGTAHSCMWPAFCAGMPSSVSRAESAAGVSNNNAAQPGVIKYLN